MKHLYLPLLFLFIIFFAVSCEPQTPETPEIPETPIVGEPEVEEIIHIPDEHFKAALVSTNSIDVDNDGVGDTNIDVNGDGEIQRSEAGLIKGLIMDFDYNAFGRYVDLTGIENFVNLTYLKITGDLLFEENNENLITYDLSGLSNLTFLELSNLGTNAFKTINLSGLENLAEIRMINSRPDYSITGEDYGNSNNFVDVNLEGNTGLKEMYIHNSFLNINFCQVPSLEKLEFSYLEGGEPEVFDFHCLTNLEWLDISENYIHSLILKNGSLLNTLGIRDIGGSNMGNYPYVQYICIDDIPEEYEQIATLADENTVVTTDCTF